MTLAQRITQARTTVCVDSNELRRPCSCADNPACPCLCHTGANVHGYPEWVRRAQAATLPAKDMTKE